MHYDNTQVDVFIIVFEVVSNNNNSYNTARMWPNSTTHNSFNVTNQT